MRSPIRPAAARAVAAASAVAIAAMMAATFTYAAVPSTTQTRPAPALATGAGTGFWHTSGNQILDAAGNPVRIAGVNWYGFETPDEIAHGLWAQDYHAIINDIENLGYNTIRIPFSNQMVETPIVPQNLSFYNTGPINTDLNGLNSLQILDKIIAYAGQQGLKVILDDHRSEAGESAEQNGLWYTSAYPAAAWVNDWATLAKRYAGNPAVVGFDLRNEPHTPAGDTYAQGATWGTGDTTTDVRLAYQQAGNVILANDPGALIFCEGIGENPTSSGGINSTWWGGDLALAGQFPVQLSSPGHVVYSAHDYGPNLFQQTWFSSGTTAASLDAVWNGNWGYLYSQNIAPVWVGEFGTGNNTADVSSSTAGSQGQWFSSLVSYIKSNPWMGWTYWALNGEDPYNLLDGSYDATPASAAKQALLGTIQFPLSTAGQGTGTPSPSPSPSATLSCRATYLLVNSWATGFQAQITVADTGAAPITGWTLTWTFPGNQTIASLWNATYSQSGEQVTATAEGYNGTIVTGTTVTIGFTGSFSTSDAAPTAFAVNGTTCSGLPLPRGTYAHSGPSNTRARGYCHGRTGVRPPGAADREHRSQRGLVRPRPVGRAAQPGRLHRRGPDRDDRPWRCLLRVHVPRGGVQRLTAHRLRLRELHLHPLPVLRRRIRRLQVRGQHVRRLRLRPVHRRGGRLVVHRTARRGPAPGLVHRSADARGRPHRGTLPGRRVPGGGPGRLLVPPGRLLPLRPAGQRPVRPRPNHRGAQGRGDRPVPGGGPHRGAGTCRAHRLRTRT